jgi:hydrogenase expression/formation protein HypD
LKFIDEYRDAEAARALARELARITTRPWTLMEVCGGQTHAIVRFGLDALLPPGVELVHGPGCPVCVTPVELIDKAIAIAKAPAAILCSFGDMARVPGTEGDLLTAKAEGADVRILYSPLDALEVARGNPGKEVVFFAVGFETTAPATAMAVHRAAAEGLANFSLLMSHVLVPPAMRAILASAGNRVQGFLAAGHVCAVMGFEEYLPIARQFKVPIVVTGFEPVDILQGACLCVRQLEEGRAEVENQYVRSVRRSGNLAAQRLMREVFRVVPREWRGLGAIPESGLGLADAYAGFDAERRFAGVAALRPGESSSCISGQVLTGTKKPVQCPAFASECTPDHPLGAPMVSSEGACAAYYRYRRVAGEAIA